MVNFRHKIFLIATLALTAILMGLALPFKAPALAQENDTLAVEINAGFDGYYKEGNWIPIRVLVENNGPKVEGRLEVSIPRLNNAVTTYSYPISLPTTSRKIVYLSVFPEGFLASSSLKVALTENDRELVAAQQRVTALNPADRLVGVIASSPSAFNLFADLDPPDGNTFVAQLEPEELPKSSQALTGVDVLALSDIDTGNFSAVQFSALENWVATGGQLFVSGGTGWQKTAAGVADLLPLKPNATTIITNPAALVEFAGLELQTLTGNMVVATGDPLPGAKILLEQDGIPLIISREIGNGEVLYLASDPAFEPLRSWAGTEIVYGKLLAQADEIPGWADGFQNWDSALEASKSLTGLSLPLSWMVCGFLGLYVIILGPLNLFFLNKFRRRELAWVTIPVLVVVFSALAFILGSQFRGGKPILNRLAVVQIWPGVERAQVDGTIGVFSPHRKTYDLRLEENFISHPIPNSRGIAGSDWLIREEADGFQVADIHMEVGELTALAAEGSIAAPKFEGAFTFEVSDRDAVLIGEIANQSAIILRDAVLLAPGSALSLGDFLPGETRPLQISLQSASRSLPALHAPNSSGSLQPSGYYYYPVNDQTIVDILGTNAYYDDPTINRRFNLLNASLGTDQGTIGRTTGVYLTGWSEASPIPISLEGDVYQEEGESLYVVALPTEIGLSGDSSMLPPALFAWSMLSSGPMDNSSPYDTRLYPGEVSLQYRLTYPIQYTMIEDLVLHLQSSGSSGESRLDIALWNFKNEAWEQLPELNWGDYHIPEAQKFVSEKSEIRIRVENASSPNGIAIEAIDFSLVVTH